MKPKTTPAATPRPTAEGLEADIALYDKEASQATKRSLGYLACGALLTGARTWLKSKSGFEGIPSDVEAASVLYSYGLSGMSLRHGASARRYTASLRGELAQLDADQTANSGQTQSAERDTYPKPSMMQFNDGEVALQFRTKGEELDLSDASSMNFARVGLTGMALVKTESGNVYGLGRGVIMNDGNKRGFPMPEDLSAITVGKQWEVPGVLTTSPVESVTFRYKVTQPGYCEEQLDVPSPFKALEHNIQLLKEQDPQLQLQ